MDNRATNQDKKCRKVSGLGRRIVGSVSDELGVRYLAGGTVVRLYVHNI